MKPKLVVVGNGMAGVRTVEEFLKLAPALYDITIFGEEPTADRMARGMWQARDKAALA
jgi:NAD(P)H-nitrite reductase large subunit